MDNIAYCRTYPGIGIARVGNSPTEFFVGPEIPGAAADPGGSFKDGAGRVKRQASRFRVFAFDAQDAVLGELTSASATLTWTVHLANKKAAWFQFRGFAAEQQAQHGDPLPLRNAGTAAREKLVIDAGPCAIAGASTGGPPYALAGRFFDTDVTLGELRTDSAGRLLVLGGHGTSASVAPNNAIRSYANNDSWYDDTSDGPVTVAVTLPDGTDVPVRGTSWVIVAPPDFSPSTDNIVTLYDVAEDVAVRSGWLPAAPDTSFTRDILPIFARLSSYQWVNAAALLGHGPGTAGALLEQLAVLSDSSAAATPARRNVFTRLRTPTPASDAAARAQANYAFMPQLSGDEGDETVGDPTTWFSLLPSQYAHLQRWAAGDFQADWDPDGGGAVELDALPVAEIPAALDRAALEHCVGGPFFPGIEMTFIARDPDTYSGAFRLRPDLEPGDVTKRMAVPWQADFYQCSTHWWPAQRPDDVVAEASFRAVVEAFGAEAGDPAADPATMLRNRVAWARGVEKNVVVPQPEVPVVPGETDEQHRRRVQVEWARRRALAGDDGFVDRWSEMGFVVPRTLPNGAVALVESERVPYAGLQDRDYFHIMLNLDAYPDFLPTARQLAEGFLEAASVLQDDPQLPDTLRAFPYSAEALDARLDEIYNSLVSYAEQYTPAGPGVIFKTRADIVERIRQFAPFNQLDGAWLRNVTQAGPIDEVHAFLFSIWSDETGNGSPELNHANLYTDLLHSVGLYPEDISTAGYAADPTMLDSAYTSALFELVVSQFSQRYLPELLGMTLNLEWEVLALKPTIALFEYFGVNAQFYRMHVGIDNAVNGHGALAKQAVVQYLDRVRVESGEQEVQSQWRRIWNGYVAFATTGNLGQDLADQLNNPPSLQTRMEDLVARKQRYGQLNHDHKRVGANLINDWFNDPPAFLQALQDAGLIVPGDPDNSPFFGLTAYTGPMYKVFRPDELELWEDWTRSLTTSPPPAEPDIAAQMVGLVQIMAVRQEGQPGHAANELVGPDPADPPATVRKPVAWWFEQSPTDLLAAISEESNGWIVRGDPANSRFITELASGNHPMALALGGIVPGSPHRTWRSVVFDWIAAGCPLPPATPRAADNPAFARPAERLSLTSPAALLDDTTPGRILGNGALH